MVRQLARSTASPRQTLRFLRPTNGPRSSNSRASQRCRWAFFGCRQGKGGATAAALFYLLGNRITRPPGVRAMRRNALRSNSSWSTWAYSRAFPTAVG